MNVRFVQNNELQKQLSTRFKVWTHAYFTHYLRRSRGISFATGLSRQCETSLDFLEPSTASSPKDSIVFQSVLWCATHSVCRRQVWADATRVSHATCADPYPGVCLARTPWWSCPKNTHTPPHFTTYYSITLILTLLLSTYTTSTRWLTSVLSSLARGDNAIGTIGWNFCTWKIKELWWIKSRENAKWI